jgi:hypothetical protein
MRSTIRVIVIGLSIAARAHLIGRTECPAEAACLGETPSVRDGRDAVAPQAPIGKVAPATSMLKPSEIAPLSTILLAEILHDAGVPKGVFNLVNGDGPTVGGRPSWR